MDAGAPPTASGPASVALPVATAPHVTMIESGDNLWELAAREVARARGVDRHQLRDADIARYWVEVCDANRASLPSGDVNLVHPGESVVLPAFLSGARRAPRRAARPLVATTLPPSARATPARSVKRPPASCTTTIGAARSHRCNGGACPLDLDRDVDRALGDEHVAPEVTEPAGPRAPAREREELRGDSLFFERAH